jgi:iron complex outermembrane receptor protein
VNQLLNAAHVLGLGIETDLEVLLSDNFRIIANASYNDTEIDDPDLRDDLCGSSPTCTGLDPVVGSRVGPFGPVTEVSIDGNPLPRTPNWLANLIMQYDMPMQSGGTLYVNTDCLSLLPSNARWAAYALATGVRATNGMRPLSVVTLQTRSSLTALSTSST